MLPPRNPLLRSQQQVSAVTVEYTAKAGTRARKEFRGANAVAASRAFYRVKLRDGKDPRVVGAERPAG